MAEDWVLEMRNISKTYPGTKALNQVQLQVKRGEVHALIGENGAGKSTLVNIISGVCAPDPGGELLLEGQPLVNNNPALAQALGIGLVHQEISMCPHLSVAENIYIGKLPQKGLAMVDYKQLHQNCAALLQRFPHQDIRPADRVDRLNVAQQQVVEIARALSYELKLLILDEPTSSLTEQETVELFRIIRELRDQGISVLYISHRMSEIFEICDRLTVLKDGQYVATLAVRDTTTDQLVSLMVGRSIGSYYPAKEGRKQGQELLRVEHFQVDKYFGDVGFSLYQGEILGFAGLVGSGRTELMRAICALEQVKGGALYLGGRELKLRHYKEALQQGLVYMTEDRKLDGLFLDMGILPNVSAAVIDRLKRYLFVQRKQEQELAQEYVQALNIKISSLNQRCGSLSGGNQQKVLLAKSLAIRPRVLIIDEPTRGIDINVKTEIYRILHDLAAQGVGVIVISSELPEVIGLCDRIVVMREGQISGVVSGEDLAEETIMRYASKVS